MASTADAVRRFTTGLERVSAFYAGAGAELAEVFADFALSKELEDDHRIVCELFVAWREVGEAEITLAEKARELCACLKVMAKRCDSERTQRHTEAQRLRSALSTAVSASAAKRTSAATGGGGGWLGGWLGGGAAEVPVFDEEAESKRLESQRCATDACLDHIAEEMAASLSRHRTSLADGVADVRRFVKIVGEKVSVLKPSWRGTSGSNPRGKTRRATSSDPSTARAADGASGSKITGLIRSLSTVEGRQRHQETQDRLVPPPVFVDNNDKMLAPPVEPAGEGLQRIRGVYEHMVLKVGLRLLDERWATETQATISNFPRTAAGSSALLRESLMRDLLIGKIRLQSVTINDVSAAQNDVKKLSLHQLLRLRVLHLDYTPSGCGSDTVATIGAAHEGFMSAVDSLLFRALGQKATAGLAASGANAVAPADMHRVGREAMFFMAASVSISSPVWWCWWITDDRRVFFDAASFVSSPDFPSATSDTVGVLEVADFSKPDKHEPSGRLRWFDWRVEHVKEQASLSPEPKRAGGGQGNGSVCATDAADDAGPPEDTQRSLDVSCSVGGATAAMVNPAMLRGLRNSLRRTDTRGCNEVTSGAAEDDDCAEANASAVVSSPWASDGEKLVSPAARATSPIASGSRVPSPITTGSRSEPVSKVLRPPTSPSTNRSRLVPATSTSSSQAAASGDPPLTPAFLRDMRSGLRKAQS
eukprot:TRINITY_DN76936_c0_g1_i1.p1 TRINITY_DN76936_c0_g1~~TRINITY_DN76936_c0_g1_i1.p1  ORF type:complete len:747 (-),score=129.87 TRINITY_DN76936_c0_g1_i1:189-2306(-)